MWLDSGTIWQVLKHSYPQKLYDLLKLEIMLKFELKHVEPSWTWAWLQEHLWRRLLDVVGTHMVVLRNPKWSTIDTARVPQNKKEPQITGGQLKHSSWSVMIRFKTQKNIKQLTVWIDRLVTSLFGVAQLEETAKKPAGSEHQNHGIATANELLCLDHEFEVRRRIQNSGLIFQCKLENCGVSVFYLEWHLYVERFLTVFVMLDPRGQRPSHMWWRHV